VSSRDWLELLLPTEEEQDPRFRAQIDRLSIIGLRIIIIIIIIIAAVCVTGVLYRTLAGLLLSAEVEEQLGGLALPITILVLGAFAVAVSFWRRARPHARLAGRGCSWVTALP